MLWIELAVSAASIVYVGAYIRYCRKNGMEKAARGNAILILLIAAAAALSIM